MEPEIKDHALEHYEDDHALEVEDSLWWLSGRKAIIASFLEKASRRLRVGTLLDVGCGSGGNLEVLSRYGRVIGVERSEVLARRARSRGIAEAIIDKDAGDISEPIGAEVITLFDVLEHVEHESDLLQKLKSLGASRHLLLVSVPAGPFLYGDHDRILHHFRRYSTGMLRSALESADYRVLETGYYMFFLWPVAVLARLKDRFDAGIGRKRKTIDVGAVPPLINRLLAATLVLEASIGKRLRLPVGLWLFALAESSQ